MPDNDIFTRDPANPIITPAGIRNAHSIFNSAVTPFGDGYAGVFRVDSTRWFSELRTGRSPDGMNWEIADGPLAFTSGNDEIEHLNRPENSPYDPRITRLDDMFYVTFCHYPTAGSGPASGLAGTRDFRTFTLMADVMLPFNRNTVLFPRKIGGQYAALHRPSDAGHTPFGEIFYATSPDLVHWGNHRFVFGPGQAWQATKVGPGPAPIETPEGWLLIYHGVKTTCSGFIYCAGGALLDLTRPWIVRYRSGRYLLAPREPYERVGDVPNVVFPTGVLLDGEGGMTLYYGCADTCIAVARARAADVIAFIKETSLH